MYKPQPSQQQQQQQQQQKTEERFRSIASERWTADGKKLALVNKMAIFDIFSHVLLVMLSLSGFQLLALIL